MTETQPFGDIPRSIQSERSILQIGRGMRSYLSAGDYDLVLSGLLPSAKEFPTPQARAILAAPSTLFPTGNTVVEIIEELGNQVESFQSGVLSKNLALQKSNEQPIYLITHKDRATWDEKTRYEYTLITPENAKDLLKDADKFAFLAEIPEKPKSYPLQFIGLAQLINLTGKCISILLHNIETAN